MGTQQRRRREKRRRRQDILDAARALFWEKGYGGTTMPELAEAAELAPGTLYLYFPGKSALYAELLIEGYDLLLERLQAEVAGDGSPREQAAALIDAFLRFAQDCPEYFDIIFFLLQKEYGGTRDALEPEQVERLQAKEDACKAIAAEVIERVDGTRSAAEVSATVDAAWSMLVGLVSFFGRRDGKSFSSVAGEARKLLVEAVFGAG